MAPTLPARVGVDHEQPEVRPVLALGHGHHARRGITEELGRLVRGKERVAELGLRGRVGQPAAAERGDGGEVRPIERLQAQCGQAASLSAPWCMPTR